MINKLNFYQEVRVKESAKVAEFRGKKGIVVGISADDNTIYSYQLSMYGEAKGLLIEPDDIEPTGVQLTREEYYGNSPRASLRVSQEGEVLGGEIDGIPMKPEELEAVASVLMEGQEVEDDSEEETEEERPPAIHAGGTCLQEGWWMSPADSEPRRYFKKGDVMPNCKADYGKTIWQWSDNQDSD